MTKARRSKNRSTALAADVRFMPRLNDIPIPDDVPIDPEWPETLLELAQWIGASDALRLCDALGGQQLYISLCGGGANVRPVLSEEKAAVLVRLYGGSRLDLPTAQKEIRTVRRGGIIAAIRAGKLSVMAGAQLAGTARSHMSYLVNKTNQGVGMTPVTLPEPIALGMLRQAADAVIAQLGAAGVDPAIVADAWAAVMSVWSPSEALPILPAAPIGPAVSETPESALHGA